MAPDRFPPGFGAGVRLFNAGDFFAAHDAMPGSRLEVFAGAGHFPHREHPARFVSVLEDFVATTEPAAMPESRWRDLLRAAR